VIDGAKSVAFGAGRPDPAKSSWTLNPAASPTNQVALRANTGDAYDLTVLVKSGAGIKVDNANVRVLFDGAGAASALSLKAPSVSPAFTGTPTVGVWGEYTWLVQSNSVGEFTFKVQVNDGASWKTIGSDVFVRFRSDDVPAASESWLVDVPSTLTVNSTHTVTARVRDQYGQPASDGFILFRIPSATCVAAGGSGPALTPNGIKVVPVASGVAKVDVTSNCSGVYEVTAEVVANAGATSGDQIMAVKDASATLIGDPNVRSNGVVELKWQAGAPNKGTSTLSVPSAAGGATKVVHTEHHTAQIVVRDGDGNPVGSQNVTFTYQHPSAASATAVVRTTNAAGVATLDINSDVAGVYSVRG
jgi:hypothetical protein